VLEFDIENVQVLRERSRDVALGVLEIGLNLHLSPFGKFAFQRPSKLFPEMLESSPSAWSSEPR